MNLFIIEAPGKCKSLRKLLWQVGERDCEVMATIGHLGTNPPGFKPIAIDEGYRETAYRLKPDREALAAAIAATAKRARRIYVATDDDQEGDVIARDVVRFCLDVEDRPRVLRLKLRSLVASEVKVAIANAVALEELAATAGDTRRIVDRLVGALSSDSIAVGRVQGSLLLQLRDHLPIAGVFTHTLRSDDDRGDWTARSAVYAGQPLPRETEHDGAVRCGHREMATFAHRPMRHSDIVLSASIATGEPIERVSGAMQRLYEQGRLSYPRSKDHAITPEAFRRVQAIAQMNGAGFDPGLFRAVRGIQGTHTHEAPNPTVLDVSVNRDLALLSFDEAVLVHITRHLIDCGIPCYLERPRSEDLERLPTPLATLDWHRLQPLGQRLWRADPPVRGYKAWTPEQSLLHFASTHALGRPSTILHHVDKFLERDLVTRSFHLTEKGRTWSAHIAALFGEKNISKIVEQYLDTQRGDPSTMVPDILERCGLKPVTDIIQQEELEAHL